MFQSQALTRSDSTLVPCLWCCLYITFSTARPNPKALLVYFFHISDYSPPPIPRTSTLVLSVWNTPPPGGKGVTMCLLPCLLPTAPVSVCLTVLTSQTAH